MNRFRLKLFISLISCIVLLWACAIIVPPTGGEKDVTPPKIARAQPENFSTHFEGQKIRLYFNEYVNFSLQNSQLIISPPLRKTPEVIMRGKSIIISFNDTLKKNTTYTFNFGSTLSDLNEGNVLKGFRYVFSTGDIIDTLCIQGAVYDAISGMPLKEVTIMLHDTTSDSAVFKERPLFATISDEYGRFRFDNLPARKFNIIALKDGNTNYLYDLATEEIGFLDTTVTPYPSISDSAFKLNPSKNLVINLFTEKDSVQRLMKYTQPHKGTGVLIFTFPLTHLQLKPLFSRTDWEPIFEYNLYRDTVQFWYKLNAEDTMSITVGDKNNILDTLLIDQRKNAKSGKTAFEKQKLGVLTNIQSDWLNLKDTLQIWFSSPIEKMDIKQIIVFQDSNVIQTTISRSGKNQRTLQFVYPWKESNNYSVFIKDSVVQDIYGRFNDSLKVKFQLKPAELYGTIILNFKPSKTEGPYILQLTQKQGGLISQKTLNQAQVVKYELLNPGEYTLKVILDKNKNQQWDTGHYLKKVQAENVFNLPSVINVRANWDTEVDWSF